MRFDQNTTVSLAVVGTVVSGMAYFGYVAGQFEERVKNLDAVKIEQRLSTIEITLKVMNRRQSAGAFLRWQDMNEKAQ